MVSRRKGSHEKLLTLRANPFNGHRETNIAKLADRTSSREIFPKSDVGRRFQPFARIFFPRTYTIHGRRYAHTVSGLGRNEFLSFCLLTETRCTYAWLGNVFPGGTNSRNAFVPSFGKGSSPYGFQPLCSTHLRTMERCFRAERGAFLLSALVTFSFSRKPPILVHPRIPTFFFSPSVPCPFSPQSSRIDISRRGARRKPRRIVDREHTVLGDTVYSREGGNFSAKFTRDTLQRKPVILAFRATVDISFKRS